MFRTGPRYHQCNDVRSMHQEDEQLETHVHDHQQHAHCTVRRADCSVPCHLQSDCRAISGMVSHGTVFQLALVMWSHDKCRHLPAVPHHWLISMHSQCRDLRLNCAANHKWHDIMDHHLEWATVTDLATMSGPARRGTL